VAVAHERLRAHGWRRVLACLDARMHEVYAAAYAREETGWRESAAPTVGLPMPSFRPAAGRGSWAGAGNGSPSIRRLLRASG
jgi:tRNA threonylcarbamoyladenosine biosynthesis protein TsaB